MAIKKVIKKKVISKDSCCANYPCRKHRKQLPIVQLHGHCEYSLKDGVGTVEQYVDKAIELGMKHFTITNHGSIGQWIRQYFYINEKRQEGIDINGIFGAELYISPNRDENLSRIVEINETIQKEKGNKNLIVELRDERKRLGRYNHILFLAKNEKGKRNLTYLHNEAQKQGYYFVPRTTHKILEDHCEGLIITSACMGSDICQPLLKGDYDTAKKMVKYYKELVGDDFYIELQLHDFTGQDTLNKALIRLAQETKTKMIITNDFHYPNKEDSVVQDTLLLMQNNNTWADVEESQTGGSSDETEVEDDSTKKKIWLFESKQLWYKSEQEIFEEWERNHSHYLPYDMYEKAILTTVEVAEKCEPNISFGEEKGNYIPDFYGTDEEARALLMQKCREGFKWRKLHLKKNRKEYIERLEHEVHNIITPTECSNYLLIVNSYVMGAKEKYGEENVGPGRGSGAGLLVNYVLGITDIDPLEFHLIAERFMNPERKDMADIDVDFSPDIRDDVKKDIENTFGTDHTASISVWGTFGTRSVVSDVARVYNIDFNEVKKVTAQMESDADEYSIEELIEMYPKFKEFHDKYNDPEDKKNYKPGMFHCIKTLRGQIKNLGKHAAGVVVTKNKIDYDVAIVRAEDKESKTIHYLSAWVEGATRSELGAIGRPKFDILGLTTLKEQKEINDIIEERHGKRVDLSNIPLSDKKAYQLARSGENEGVFQLHSSTMCRLCQDANVQDVLGVSAVSAVGRPATLRAGVAKKYCDRASGKDKKWKIDDRLKSILGPTYGVIVFQETTMFLPAVMADFTMAEADKMRKFLSKIKEDKVEEYAEKIKELKDKFIKNSIKNGYDEDYVKQTWNQIWEFRTYGFNKSHSDSYAILTNRDLYLKAYYPVEFWTGKLNNTKPKFDSAKGEESKTERYANTLKRYGLALLPPRINYSKPKFSVESDNEIRYGLWFVKGVKNNAFKILNDKTYEVFDDFWADNKKLGKAVMIALISVGYFDDIFENRKQLLSGYEEWVDKDKNNKKGDLLSFVRSYKNVDNFNDEDLAELEKQYIGFYLSGHPFDNYRDLLSDNELVSVTELLEDEYDVCKVAGVVSKVKVITARNGQTMAFVELEDGIEKVDITIFGTEYEMHNELLEKGSIVAMNIKKNDRGYNVTGNKKGQPKKKQIVDLKSLIEL